MSKTWGVRTCLVVCSAAVFVVLCVLRSRATVPVVAPTLTTFATNYRVYLNGRPCGVLPADQCAAATSVYTVDEVNGIRDDLKGQIDSTVKDGGLVDQRVGAAESRLKQQIETSLNGLPQRLLSEEAKKSIQDALTGEMKASLEQIRKDLQSQIDELKKNSGGQAH